MMNEPLLSVVVTSRQAQGKDVVVLELSRRDGGSLPAFEAGRACGDPGSSSRGNDSLISGSLASLSGQIMYSGLNVDRQTDLLAAFEHVMGRYQREGAAAHLSPLRHRRRGALVERRPEVRVRAIAYANGGRFRVRSQHEQEVWNECARLIANAIVHYNALLLSEVLKAVQDQQDAAAIAAG